MQFVMYAIDTDSGQKMFTCPRATQHENSTCPSLLQKFPVSDKSSMGFLYTPDVG